MEKLWDLGVGYADDFPAGRDAEMAFLRTCRRRSRSPGCLRASPGSCPSPERPKLHRLEENIAAANITLSNDDLTELTRPRPLSRSTAADPPTASKHKPPSDPATSDSSHGMRA